jgi:predicted amino acid-binding ACT domain protein
VSGYFTITLAVAIPTPGKPNALVDSLQQKLGPDAAVTMIPFRQSAAPTASTDRYILTATGEASTAVIRSLTALVAERGGNFVDFSFQNSPAGVSFVAELDLPTALALNQLQIDLQHVGADAGLRVRLQHQRLFTATNEIAFRRVGS